MIYFCIVMSFICLFFGVSGVFVLFVVVLNFELVVLSLLRLFFMFEQNEKLNNKEISHWSGKFSFIFGVFRVSHNNVKIQIMIKNKLK